jgi:hypothetical protein
MNGIQRLVALDGIEDRQLAQGFCRKRLDLRRESVVKATQQLDHPSRVFRHFLACYPPIGHDGLVGRYLGHVFVEV